MAWVIVCKTIIDARLEHLRVFLHVVGVSLMGKLHE
jgi:hypothetical protein